MREERKRCMSWNLTKRAKVRYLISAEAPKTSFLGRRLMLSISNQYKVRVPKVH